MGQIKNKASICHILLALHDTKELVRDIVEPNWWRDETKKWRVIHSDTSGFGSVALPERTLAPKI